MVIGTLLKSIFILYHEPNGLHDFTVEQMRNFLTRVLDLFGTFHCAILKCQKTIDMSNCTSTRVHKMGAKTI